MATKTTNLRIDIVNGHEKIPSSGDVMRGGSSQDESRYSREEQDEAGGAVEATRTVECQ